jgi:hypothetical protein
VYPIGKPKRTHFEKKEWQYKTLKIRYNKLGSIAYLTGAAYLKEVKQLF